ncbi:hypothetical protein HYPSUDRAFT_37448 [Hypholoma sublateritium FD-334 SS-4]|uniref:Amidohydrolase 3 domain-containing protein n=1 Tax=Hypholoma sublateritium (strain FD-334 SS-4) TaxID=945553 RepID=A0A0D2LDH6_HYPSF|nr:hypothetical protein HYPSUDRAFT_37448 [Hypholoma sublateritium FD-334 SS-4]
MDSKLSREPRRNLQTHATDSESNSTHAGLVFLNYPLQSSYAVCSPSRNIYTADDTVPRAECIAVCNARIVHVGSCDKVVRPQRYFEGSNFFLWWFVDRLAVVRFTMVIHLHEDVILVPGLADLVADQLLKDRLISLSRVDGHARWVSPAALELMPNLPEQVKGGLIMRDAEGNPTGAFVDNAMDLIPIPPWSEKQITEFFDMTMKQALSHGLTSIHDADAKPAHIAFFQKLADAGKLPALPHGQQRLEYWGDTLPKLIDYGKHARLNLRSVKLIADGAPGSWGAALLEPYSHDLATSGLMLSSPEKLERQIRQFWADGWQTKNATESRPRIERAQIFIPAYLVRIGKLGVIASVQPTHATSDMGYAQIRLGPDRIKGAYAYQTLPKASPQGVLPLGSDFLIEGVNPLLGFYAAASRLYVDATSPHGLEGWFSEQKLTRAQALKGMTLDAAYASFAEHDLGSLTPGKKADFVVFNKDIMTVPYDKILEAKVVATVLDAEVAYGTL